MHTKRTTPIRNSYIVVSDKLYAGEYPRDFKINQFIKFGITDFIDLTEDDELFPYTQFLPDSAGYYHFPVTEHFVPESEKELECIIAKINELIAQGRKVYVHCRGGIGRTGTVIACWLAQRQALDDEQTYASFYKLWSNYPKSQLGEPFNDLQKEFINKYVAHLKLR